MTVKAKGKRKFLKNFIITISSLLVLILVAFWMITSSFFITGVILPMVSDSIDLQIDAEHVDLSIFKSRLKAKNLLIWSGKTPLLKAEKLDGGFSLFDLLAGRFVFRDVLLDKAIITIARDPKGKWNYEDPQQVVSNIVIKKTISAAPSAKGSKNDDDEKIFIDLKNIQITNSSFILALGDITRAPDRMEFQNLNINLPEFKNNKASTLTLKANVSVKSKSGITVEKGEWNATLTAAFDDYLHPYTIKLDSNLNKLDGIINGVKINNSNLAFDIDAHGDKKSIVIKKFYLRQMDKGFIKTNVELSSYINFDPFKIKGEIKIAPLSSEIISVVCQFTRQINPGKVGAGLISDFEYSNNIFSGAGQLRLTRKKDAVIAGKKYKLPDMSLKSKYDFRFDNSKNILQVKHFNAELKDREKIVLLLSSDHDFTYFFGEQAFLKKRKPQIALKLRQLDLTMLKLMQAPDAKFTLHNGKLDGDIVCILDSKRKLRFGANIRADNLDFQVDDKRFKNIGFEQKIAGFISKKLLLSIPEFSLNLSSKQKNILSFAGMANFDFKNNNADFSLNMGDFSSQKIASLPLPENVINKITGITAKLDPFSLSASSSGSMQLDKGKIKLKPVNVNLFQQNKKVLNISIQPHDGNPDNFGKNSKTILTVTNLSAKQFKKVIDADTLIHGDLNGKIVAKVKDDFNSIIVDSALNIDNIELLSSKKIFKNLRFNLGFTTSILKFDEIKIKEFVCGMRYEKNLILGLSGFGNMKLSEGKGKLDLSLDHLTYNSLNIVTPGTLRSGIIKGNLKVNIQDNFKDWKVKSDLDIMRLAGGSATAAVNGKSSFDIELKPNLFFCKKFFIRLNSKDGEIVVINGSTILPENNSDKPVVIKLTSKIIDISKIEKLFAPKTKVQASRTTQKRPKTVVEDTKAPEPMQFDLGGRSYVLLVDLRGIKYNSTLTASINSRINAKGRRIDVQHLQLASNQDKLNFKGVFLSTVKGIQYHTYLESREFNLNPIFHACLKDDFRKMKGTLKNLYGDMKGTGLQPVALWDNMQGTIRSDFADVKIPNDLSKTTMGKIFLLPFDIMVDIQKMVPGKVVETMGQASRYILEFQRDMKVLNFTDGKMRIDADDGLMYIRDFQLHGRVVKNLSFIGKFGLGTRQLLDLKSSLNVNGIILPVDIAGTVEKPKINYSATTINFMRANTFTILDTTGKILEKGGGDAKKILDIIFN